MVQELASFDSLLMEGQKLDLLKRASVQQEFWKLIRIKESMLHKKSRAKWIKFRDYNSTFFALV